MKADAGPWLHPGRPQLAQDLQALPSRTDVAIIGGGLAGLAAATFLARGGVDVTVLEARADIGEGASGRHLGHVSTGLIEHAYRLEHALGTETATALYRFSRESHRLLAGLADVTPCGGWWVATDDREPAQLERSAAALGRMGVPAILKTSAEVSEALGGREWGQGLFLAEEGRVEPWDACAAIADHAKSAGALIIGGARVQQVADSTDGLHLTIGGNIQLRSEIVIFAANAQNPTLDPFYDNKVIPFREQALATVPLDVRLPGAGRCGYGYTTWRQAADGRLIVGGCRWATPHLEVGETDDTVVVPRVQARLEQFMNRHFDGLASGGVSARWSWIAATTCDGLPIIGPHPGDIRRISCCGFGGNQPGLALRAARAIADGLLTGTAEGVPTCLSAARFV